MLGRCISATRKSGWPSAGSCRIVYGGSGALQCHTATAINSTLKYIALFTMTGNQCLGLAPLANPCHQGFYASDHHYHRYHFSHKYYHFVSHVLGLPELDGFLLKVLEVARPSQPPINNVNAPKSVVILTSIVITLQCLDAVGLVIKRSIGL